jgi:hypothetical protein
MVHHRLSNPARLWCKLRVQPQKLALDAGALQTPPVRRNQEVGHEMEYSIHPTTGSARVCRAGWRLGWKAPWYWRPLGTPCCVQSL